MALVRVVNVEVDEAKVPVVAEDMNCLKNAREVVVIVKDSCCFQTMSESYNCSATAAVARYQGSRECELVCA